MKGVRCAVDDKFIIHDYMNPHILIEEHAAHLRNPEKDWNFWYSRPHREWRNGLLELDGLVSDLPDRFVKEFSGWIESGHVQQIYDSLDPLPHKVFEIYHVAA